MEECFAGSDTDTNSQTLSLVGNIVEAVVMVDYLTYRSSNGAVPIVFDPDAPSANATDFFDLKGDRCEQFATFLTLKNPHVNQAEIDSFCRQRKQRDGGKGMIPDVITHDGGLKEFYEVKPLSTSGTRDGRKKIRNFCEISARHGMPYIAFNGTDPVSKSDTYNPNYRKVFWWGQLNSIPAQVSLRFRRMSESLVQYVFCVEITSETVRQAALIFLAKAAIAALILTRGAAIGVLAPAAAGYFLFMRSPLLGSVGQGGDNSYADARYIQRLLNHWGAPRGVAMLGVDGDVGPLTVNAIRAFQTAETPAWVDGLVEPGRNTIKRLEELFVTSVFAGFDSDLADDEIRRRWLDDARYATALLTGNNQDPEPEPGASDPLPVDVNSVMVSVLQDLLDQLHDADFGELV